MENQDQEAFKKIKELAEEVKIAMLCTSHGAHLRSRPMSTAQIDGRGDIWFFTNEFSGKADEIENDHQVCLAYSSPSKNTYVSISGRAEILNDRAKMKELFNPALKAWFPQGLEDPKLAMLKVSPEQAEFWDNSASKMVIFFQMAKAIVSGEKFEEGEHGKIEM